MGKRVSYSVLGCVNRVQRSTCAILHVECTYLPTNCWLGNHYYSHLCSPALQGWYCGHTPRCSYPTVELILVVMVTLTFVLCLRIPIQRRIRSFPLIYSWYYYENMYTKYLVLHVKVLTPQTIHVELITYNGYMLAHWVFLQYYSHAYTNTLDCGVLTWEMFDRKHYDNIIKMCKLCIKLVQISIYIRSNDYTILYTWRYTIQCSIKFLSFNNHREK